MSGRPVNNSYRCPCKGCTVQRSREERAQTAKLRALEYERAMMRRKREEPVERRANLVKRVHFEKKTIKNQPKIGQTEVRKEKERKSKQGKHLFELTDPCFAAKMSFRTQGIKFQQILRDANWKVMAAILIFFSLSLWFPVVKGENFEIEMSDGHHLEVTRTDTALIVDSYEHQMNLCSVSEFFSKEDLGKMSNKLAEWKEVAQTLSAPKLISATKVQDWCPTSGGGGLAENPTFGPFPKLVNYLPKESKYLVIVQKWDDGIRCNYSLKESFVEIKSQTTKDLGGHKGLFAKNCRQSIEKGMIFPKHFYITYVFKTKEPANILKCSEMCTNIFERAKLNASCEPNEKFAECKPTLPQCHFWSYNVKTSFCLLYLHKKIKPNEKKISAYDKMNEHSGAASDGLTGPVGCSSFEQMKNIWMRAKEEKSSSQVSWLPVRGACHFTENFEEDFMVYSNCKETSAIMRLFISNMEDKLGNFQKLYDLKTSKNKKRKKRNAVLATQAFMSPAVQKFLMLVMTSTPTFASFSSVTVGPLLGFFFLLTSTLISVVIQLAEENQQQILSQGVTEIENKNFEEMAKTWENLSTFTLGEVKGLEDKRYFNRQFPYSGLEKVSKQFSKTINSFQRILESGQPIAQNIAKELKGKPYSYIVLDSKDFIKKIYFFTKKNKKAQKLQVSVFMSLNQDIPIQEGVISESRGFSGNPSLQCVDVFRRTGKLASECFSQNQMGSDDKNKFLIGKDKMIFKILGKKIIQIYCPENSKTTFSSGIYVFIASSNCKVQVSGNIFHQGEKHRSKGSFKVILDVVKNNTNIFVPMPKRLKDQIKNIHEEWGWKSVLVFCVNGFWFGGAITWVIWKIKRKKQKKEKNSDFRYRTPILLPMKDLKDKRKKGETSDSIERLTRK